MKRKRATRLTTQQRQLQQKQQLDSNISRITNLLSVIMLTYKDQIKGNKHDRS